jgi:predicted nucleic acid-binding protein
VRVFPDTNVLASAFGTRGLCADVLRLILGEHEPVTGEVVIEELRRVLSRKFGVPADTVQEIESLLRGYHVEPEPRHLPDLKLSERNDLLLVGSAVRANAENRDHRGSGDARSEGAARRSADSKPARILEPGRKQVTKTPLDGVSWPRRRMYRRGVVRGDGEVVSQKD